MRRGILIRAINKQTSELVMLKRLLAYHIVGIRDGVPVTMHHHRYVAEAETLLENLKGEG